MTTIAIEGIDKIGKTTQVGLLLNKLDAASIKHPIEDFYSGVVLRKILNGKTPYDPVSFQALMAINKLESIDCMKRLEENHEYVILDRWTPSGIVYGVRGGVKQDWIDKINGYLPDADITIVLSGTPHSIDNDIYGDKKLQAKLRNTYLHYATMKGWYTVDANKSVEHIHNYIMDIIEVHATRQKIDTERLKLIDVMNDCYASHTSEHKNNPSIIVMNQNNIDKLHDNINGDEFLAPILQLDCGDDTILCLGTNMNHGIVATSVDIKRK